MELVIEQVAHLEQYVKDSFHTPHVQNTTCGHSMEEEESRMVGGRLLCAGCQDRDWAANHED